MTATARAHPQAALALHLLSGLATDVPLRRIPSTLSPNSLPAPLTRALFSLLLRTSAPLESLAAQTALLHAQSLPQLSKAACLGFPADASPEQISAVLQDLLLSAVRGDSLFLNGAALTLYTEAGPDSDEYITPAPEQRVLHAATQHPLAVIRAENLSRAIVVFAHAFEVPSCRDVLLNVSSHSISRFLAPLVSHLPDNVAFLSNQLREAIHFFYAKFASVASEQTRQEFATRLVSSLMRLASVDPSGISPYMHGMADAHIRLQACRMCLVQRFGVRDSNLNNPFNVELISPYLKISPQKDRYNEAVPPLLTVLLMAWHQIDDNESFRFKANRGVNASRLARKFCVARDRIKSFASSSRDVSAFSVTVTILGSKIAECNC